jgi:hypothetical protein
MGSGRLNSLLALAEQFRGHPHKIVCLSGMGFGPLDVEEPSQINHRSRTATCAVLRDIHRTPKLYVSYIGNRNVAFVIRKCSSCPKKDLLPEMVVDNEVPPRDEPLLVAHCA